MPRERRSGEKPSGQRPDENSPRTKRRDSAVSKPSAPSASSLSVYSYSSESSWEPSRSSRYRRVPVDDDAPPLYSPLRDSAVPSVDSAEAQKNLRPADEVSSTSRRSRRTERSLARGSVSSHVSGKSDRQKSESASAHPRDDNQLVPFGPNGEAPESETGAGDEMQIYNQTQRMPYDLVTHYKAPTVETPIGTPQIERYKPMAYDPQDWVPRRSRSSRRAIEYPPQSSEKVLQKAAATQARSSRRSRSVMTPSEYSNESCRSRSRAINDKIRLSDRNKTSNMPIAELLGAAAGGAVVLIGGGNPAMALLGAAAGTFAGNRISENRKEKKLKSRAMRPDLEKGESLRSLFNQVSDNFTEKHVPRSRTTVDDSRRHGSHSRPRGQSRQKAAHKKDISDDASVLSASANSYTTESSSSSRGDSVRSEKDYFSTKHHPASHHRSATQYTQRDYPRGSKPPHPLAVVDSGYDSDDMSDRSSRHSGSSGASRHRGSGKQRGRV